MMTRNDARRIVQNAPRAIAVMSMYPFPESVNTSETEKRWRQELQDAMALLAEPVDPSCRWENV